MKKLSVIFLVLIIPILASCDYMETWTWNYRITVEVETPEGIKSGSAVRKVMARLNPRFNPDAGRVKHHVYGEAVVVDLGKRGALFALIDYDSHREVQAAFPIKKPNTKEGVEFYDSLKMGSKVELKSNHPKMASFTDIKNPKTVRLVYQQIMGTFRGQVADTIDNFENIFGEGVRLKTITIEITDDPVTWGIEGVLPEYSKIPRIFAYSSFKQGEQKNGK